MRGLRNWALLAAGVIAGLGATYMLWLRDSQWFAVRQVSVSGVHGQQGADIRNALAGAAVGMTTLHVRQDQLLASVSAYPGIKTLRVHPHLFHRLSIRVIEQPPIAVLASDHRVTLAADGSLMQGLPTDGLPTLAAPVSGGKRLTNQRALAALELLAAASPGLRSHVSRVWLGRAGEGAIVQLRQGPRLILGDASRAKAKWLAATAILRDPNAGGAGYLDLRVPDRPVAGFTPGDPRAAAVQVAGTDAPPSQ